MANSGRGFFFFSFFTSIYGFLQILAFMRLDKVVQLECSSAQDCISILHFLFLVSNLPFYMLSSAKVSSQQRSLKVHLGKGFPQQKAPLDLPNVSFPYFNHFSWTCALTKDDKKRSYFNYWINKAEGRSC